MGLRTGSSVKQRAVTALNRVSGPPHGVSNVAARTNHGAGTVYPGARLLGPPESLTATARTNHSARTVSPGPRSRGPTGSSEVGPRSGHNRGRGEGTDLPRLPGSPDTRVPFRCFAVVCVIPPSFEPEFGEKTAPSLPTGSPPAGMVAARFGRFHERKCWRDSARETPPGSTVGLSRYSFLPHQENRPEGEQPDLVTRSVGCQLNGFNHCRHRSSASTGLDISLTDISAPHQRITQTHTKPHTTRSTWPTPEPSGQY